MSQHCYLGARFQEFVPSNLAIAIEIEFLSSRKQKSSSLFSIVLPIHFCILITHKVKRGKGTKPVATIKTRLRLSARILSHLEQRNKSSFLLFVQAYRRVNSFDQQESLNFFFSCRIVKVSIFLFV